VRSVVFPFNKERAARNFPVGPTAVGDTKFRRQFNHPNPICHGGEHSFMPMTQKKSYRSQKSIEITKNLPHMPKYLTQEVG
jgi:hypothetical protein